MDKRIHIQQISLGTSIWHLPVAWKIAIVGWESDNKEKKIKFRNMVEIQFLDADGREVNTSAEVGTGLDGSVVTFDIRELSMRMYSTIPVPEGFTDEFYSL